MAKSTKEALQDADIIFNRMNVQLARQQRLLGSMLASNTTPKESSSQKPHPKDIPRSELEDEFKGETDTGGIGSKRQYDDDEMPEGAFKPRSMGVNDKLLEQMIGRKAAGQHRKAQKLAGASASNTGFNYTTPMPEKEAGPKRKVEVDSDEEDGRAAAFGNKRAKKDKVQVKTEEIKTEPVEQDRGQDQVESVAMPVVHKREKPAAKAKPMSYLDELLAKKASKKSKKKKKEPVEA